MAQSLIDTFLALAAIDEVYPHEDKVLRYIKQRLAQAGVSYHQDKVGNIVARIPGKNSETLGFATHVDIAAPLRDRAVIVTEKVIKTDGTGILGADDKAGVAALLELADVMHRARRLPECTIEMLFTVGEERGLQGAKALDTSLLQAEQFIIIDMAGPVNVVVTKSPANFKIDVQYTGKAAASALWRDGKNAGAALIQACTPLQQGELEPGVIFNIGRMQLGNARNQVAGEAWLEAELRCYDAAKLETVANNLDDHFCKIAAEYDISAEVTIDKTTGPYSFNSKGTLFAQVEKTLQKMQLTPELIEVLGCFDGNVLAGYNKEIVVMGGGYYNPHSHDEYLDIAELNQVFAFVCQVVGAA
jgi:tripeptide aminopeptidase